MRIENTGEATIPYAFLFHWGSEGVLMKEIGSIAGKEAQQMSLEGEFLAPRTGRFMMQWMREEQALVLEQAKPAAWAAPAAEEDWRPKVYETMVKALVTRGLYRREADAMVRTWWRSYFEHPGTRLFWIVPDAFVKEVLPLAVQPAPRELKRVLVGRSELLTPSSEKELLSKGEELADSYGSDRFYYAYEKRVEQLKKVAVTAKADL